MGGVTLRSVDARDLEAEQGPLTFDAVYQSHAETVARWAARLGGPGADVEDLTQEVFLVVNRRLAEFRHQSRVSTWLFSITARIVANDRRRRRVRAWWVRLVPRFDEVIASTGDTPVEHLEKRERRGQFYQALDALGERQRRALVLFELDELSIAQIAELMSMREGSVRVLLHRARAAFLEKMTEQELRGARRRAGAAAPEGEGGR